MSPPRVIIDLAKVTANARRATERCAADGVRVVGMTKGVAGHPAVAAALLDGGVEVLGDSRLDNIERLRAGGIEAPILLTRAAPPSDLERCVALADASAVTSPVVLPRLAREAVVQERPHGVVVMVELGTEREGLAPDDVEAVCRQIDAREGLWLRGLGVYFPNSSDTEYYRRNLQRLVDLKARIEATTGLKVPSLSGGSSNIFSGLTVNDRHVAGIDELRLGTAILVGTAWTRGPRYLPGYHGDAFRLESELIETKTRDGVTRGLLALGSLDTDVRHLYPARDSIRIVDASCDHTVVEFDDPHEQPQVGDRIHFGLSYPSLCHLMTSPYTRFQLLGAPGPRHQTGRAARDPWSQTS